MGFLASRRYVALLVVAGVLVVAGGLYEAKKAVDVGAPDRIAVFKVHCRSNHMAPDDPIVFPGRPGISHLHDFFGNTAVDADSNTTQLSQATSSCINGVNELDHSAYWFPALLKDNVPVPSDGNYINGYYRAGRGQGPIHPFPYGLRMIAGDSMAATPQLPRIASYGCSPAEDDRLGIYTEMPVCPQGRWVSGTVTFPTCWDGENLDSPDHMSHMAYALPDQGCPESHPVRLPELTLRIGWVATAGTGGADYSLASGGQHSLHADFWNLWAPAAQQQLIDQCLVSAYDCSEGVRARVTGDLAFPQQDWQPES